MNPRARNLSALDLMQEALQWRLLSLWHARPTAEVLIVDPDRGNRPAFNRRMVALGFALVDTRLDDEPDFRGRLLRYQRVRNDGADHRP